MLLSILFSVLLLNPVPSGVRLYDALAFDAANFPIECDGIGPVRLGRALSSLPDCCPGLYRSIDERLCGIDYHIDTTYVVVPEDQMVKVPVTAHVALYERGRLVGQEMVEEELTRVKKAGEIDTILTYTVLSRDPVVVKGDSIFILNTNLQGEIVNIRIKSPRYRTRSGLSCNSSLFDLLKHGCEIVYNFDRSPYLECDGVRFGGFPPSNLTDEEFEEWEDDYRHSRNRYFCLDDLENLPEVWQDPEVIAFCKQIHASFIDITADVTPFEWIPSSSPYGHSLFGSPSFEQYVMDCFDINHDHSISEQEMRAVQEINFQATATSGVKHYLDLSGLRKFRNATDLHLSVAQNLRDRITRTKVISHGTDTMLDAFRREESLTIANIAHHEQRISRSMVFYAEQQINSYMGWFSYELSETHTVRINRVYKEQESWISVVSTPSFQLDLEGLHKLKTLYCDNMFLGKLVGLDCPDLRVLHCSSNKLETINIRKCPNLDELSAANNFLETLDLLRNPHLHSLDVSYNSIRRLDLSANHELVVLDVSDNKLSKLDISPLERLSVLDISHNPIRRLNLSSCKELQELNFEGTDIDSLDISSCPRLMRLVAGSKLKYVKASESQRVSGLLEYLEVGLPGPVTVEIVPDITEEKELPVHLGDPTSTIDIPDPYLRKQLLSKADANGDGILTLGEAQALTELHLLDGDDFEYFSSLEGLQYFSSLQSFEITGDAYGEFKTIDLSPFSYLETFSCYGIPLESLDLSSNHQLTSLHIVSCALPYLDLSQCPHLLDFYLSLDPSFQGTLHLKLTSLQNHSLRRLISAKTGNRDLIIPQSTIFEIVN